MGQGDPLGPEPALVFEGRAGYASTADTLLDCSPAVCPNDELGLLELFGLSP